MYVTAQMPWGPGEAFIGPEVLELRRQGNEVVVFPLRPENHLADGTEADAVARQAVWLPLFSAKTLRIANCLLSKYPGSMARSIAWVSQGSRTVCQLMKNVAVIPKALAMALYAERDGYDHIHAHWGSTPSTAACIASQISGVPWSMTTHRWDIEENNLLSDKVLSAEFVRAISIRGRQSILEVIGEPTLEDKIRVIHVGVDLDQCEISQGCGCSKEESTSRVLCVGRLVPVKGHEFLIEAFRVLVERGLDATCLFLGDGPERSILEGLVSFYGLDDHVIFDGYKPHDEVIALLKSGKHEILVCPSVETEDGAAEGIPVALMEAMACGIAVIGTNTGAIPELLGQGAGLIVRQKDAIALADAIEFLVLNPEERCAIARRGRMKVETGFSISSIAEQLTDAFQAS